MEVIQIGTAMLRGANGEFIKPIPLYAEKTPETEKAEAALATDIARLMLGKVKEYADAKKAAEKEGRKNK